MWQDISTAHFHVNIQFTENLFQVKCLFTKANRKPSHFHSLMVHRWAFVCFCYVTNLRATSMALLTFSLRSRARRKKKEFWLSAKKTLALRQVRWTSMEEHPRTLAGPKTCHPWVIMRCWSENRIKLHTLPAIPTTAQWIWPQASKLRSQKEGCPGGSRSWLDLATIHWESVLVFLEKWTGQLQSQGKPSLCVCCCCSSCSLLSAHLSFLVRTRQQHLTPSYNGTVIYSHSLFNLFQVQVVLQMDNGGPCCY